MSDEFDDLPELPANRPRPPGDGGADRIAGSSVARLVSRIYRRAGDPLRAQMLACLLRPLSTLGLAAVASGAFGRFLYRGGAGPDPAALAGDGVDAVRELTRFVQEVNPDALSQLGDLLASAPMGMAALSVSALLLVLRRRRGS